MGLLQFLWVVVATTMLCFMSTSQHYSEAAPVSSAPVESSCNNSTDGDISNIHTQFSDTVDQLSDHYDSHPALQQFEAYKRQTRAGIPTACHTSTLEPLEPVPSPTPSSLLCPYELVCREDSETYPSFFYEAKCITALDVGGGVFGCKEVTYPLPVLRNVTCAEGQHQWQWDTVAMKTACVAYGAEQGYDTIRERIERVLTEGTEIELHE